MFIHALAKKVKNGKKVKNLTSFTKITKMDTWSKKKKKKYILETLLQSYLSRVFQRWRGFAHLPDVGMPGPAGRSPGGQQRPPLLRLARRHLVSACHVAGDLWCQSNSHPRREGQWSHGPDDGAALSLFPVVITETPCWIIEWPGLIYAGAFLGLCFFF